jgi:hypothetical protein
MTGTEAAWVRAHVWSAAMRKVYAEVPGYYKACDCQFGETQWCRVGQCDRCHRGTPLPSYATAICTRGGAHAAYFRETYTHPTPSATGAHRVSIALVWLADRVCRWICPHDCHQTPRPQQLDLFEVRS